MTEQACDTTFIRTVEGLYVVFDETVNKLSTVVDKVSIEDRKNTLSILVVATIEHDEEEEVNDFLQLSHAICLTI